MKKIMIIDDSATSRLYLKKCMMLVHPQEPLEFIEAKNGEDAIQKFGDNHVDLVLSDVNMPVMTGDLFLKNIKTNPALSHLATIPILFVTSLANEIKINELVADGAVGVIKKPVNTADLATIVNSIFHQPATDDENAWG